MTRTKRTATAMPPRNWIRGCWRRIRQAFAPQASIERDPYLLLCGHACFQTLVAGCKLGLFDHLSAHPARTAQEITAQLGIPARSVTVLLHACASIGLVKRDRRDGTYRNSRWSEQRLVRARTGNQLPLIEAYHALWYQPLFSLTESLRQGTNVGLSCFSGPGATLYERMGEQPELEQVFHGWMSALNPGGVPTAAVTAASKHARLLDLGGGHATNAMDLVRRCPGLRVTILDFPSVCAHAGARIAQAGLADRISTVAGNFLEAPFPDGIDAILCAQILPIYDEDTNRELIRKCAQALPPGGELIVYNGVSNDDAVGPLSTAVHSLYFLGIATGTGMVYPWEAYEKWFRAAGFSSTTTTRMGSQGIFVATK